MSSKLHQAALDYHQGKRPGKLIVSSHKPLETREDLSLAYKWMS
jgi:malic enzyme